MEDNKVLVVQEKSFNEESDKNMDSRVKISVWRREGQIGHIVLETFSNNGISGKDLVSHKRNKISPGVYVSFFPGNYRSLISSAIYYLSFGTYDFAPKSCGNKNCNRNESHFHTKETDESSRGYKRPADESIDLYGLDVAQIHKKFMEFRNNQFSWGLFSSSFFIDVSSSKNCASLVYQLLIFGNVQKYISSFKLIGTKLISSLLVGLTYHFFDNISIYKEVLYVHLKTNLVRSARNLSSHLFTLSINYPSCYTFFNFFSNRLRGMANEFGPFLDYRTIFKYQNHVKPMLYRDLLISGASTTLTFSVAKASGVNILGSTNIGLFLTDKILFLILENSLHNSGIRSPVVIYSRLSTFDLIKKFPSVMMKMIDFKKAFLIGAVLFLALKGLKFETGIAVGQSTFASYLFSGYDTQDKWKLSMFLFSRVLACSFANIIVPEILSFTGLCYTPKNVMQLVKSAAQEEAIIRNKEANNLVPKLKRHDSQKMCKLSSAVILRRLSLFSENLQYITLPDITNQVGLKI